VCRFSIRLRRIIHTPTSPSIINERYWRVCRFSIRLRRIIHTPTSPSILKELPKKEFAKIEKLLHYLKQFIHFFINRFSWFLIKQDYKKKGIKTEQADRIN
ncbi:MAG: hypothetical protein K9H13_11135, partial [Bacteroidales bacterium]|nr:hypothetical protein [Bacteroidales bacterium]